MARQADVVLEEILHAIGMIEDVASGHDRASFGKAAFQQRGIERLLEIISEAVRHLPDEMLAWQPGIPGPTSARSATSSGMNTGGPIRTSSGP